jgi:hypothetical protein
VTEASLFHISEDLTPAQVSFSPAWLVEINAKIAYTIDAHSGAILLVEDLDPKEGT